MNAQDTLYLKTQTKLLAHVHLIHSKMVYYTLPDDASKIEYTLTIAELEKIVFSNGKQEHFQGFNFADEVYAPKKEPVVIFKNSLSLNLLPIMNGNLAFQYQRNFLKQGFSLVVPVAFMFTNYPLLTRETPNELQLDKKIYDLGIGLYLNEKNKTSYFYIGPLFQLQEYNCRCTYTILHYDGYLYQYVQKAVFNRFIGAITTGYYMGAGKRFGCNMFFSLGYRYDKFQNTMYLPFTETPVTTLPYPGAPYAYAGINLCLNF
jgi:hypothetical protein